MGSRRLGACLLVLGVWFANHRLQTLVFGPNPGRALQEQEGLLEKARLHIFYHEKRDKGPKLLKMLPRTGKGGKKTKQGITRQGKSRMQRKIYEFQCVFQSECGKDISESSWKRSKTDAFISAFREFVAYSPKTRWDWTALQSALEKLRASPTTWREWKDKHRVQEKIRNKLKSLKPDRKRSVSGDLRHAYRAQPALKKALNLLHLLFQPAACAKNEGGEEMILKQIDEIFLAICREQGLVAEVSDPSGLLRFLAFGDALGDFLEGKSSAETAIFGDLIQDARNDERGDKSEDMRTALQIIHQELLGVLKDVDGDAQHLKFHHYDWVYNFLCRCVEALELDVTIELIGSFATRTEVSTSDVDFLIVGEMDEDSILKFGQCIKEGNTTDTEKGKPQVTVRLPRIFLKHSKKTCKHGYLVSFNIKRGWNITVVKRAGKICRQVDSYDVLLDTDEMEPYRRTLQSETRREAQIRDLELFYDNKPLARAVRWVRRITESAKAKHESVKCLKGILIRELVRNISVTKGLEAEHRDPTGILIAEAVYTQIRKWQSPQDLL